MRGTWYNMKLVIRRFELVGDYMGVGLKVRKGFFFFSLKLNESYLGKEERK